MRGHALTHVGGGDRPVPVHVPYSEPKARPTGLDWDKLRAEPTTAAEVVEAKPTCNHCHEHVDAVSVHTGMCPSCELELDPHNQTPPTAPQEPAMTQTPHFSFNFEGRDIPSWILDLVELLTATEAHPDTLVRATRKIVTQSAIALQQAVAAAPQTSGSDATATAQPTPSDDGSTSTSEPEAPPVNGHLSVRQRLIMLNVDQATVHEWAVEHGVPHNRQGTIRTEVLDAYEAAHRGSAA